MKLKLFLLILIAPYALWAQDASNTTTWKETITYLQDNIDLLSNKQETVQATEHSLVKSEIVHNDQGNLVYTYTVPYKALQLVEITDTTCDPCVWGLVLVANDEEITFSIDNKSWVHAYNYISLDYYRKAPSKGQLAVVSALQHLSFLRSKEK